MLAIVEGNAKPNTKAVELLGQLGTTKSIAVLKELSSHKDHWVNKAAKEALGKVGVRVASE